MRGPRGGCLRSEGRTGSGIVGIVRTAAAKRTWHGLAIW